MILLSLIRADPSHPCHPCPIAFGEALAILNGNMSASAATEPARTAGRFYDLLSGRSTPANRAGPAQVNRKALLGATSEFSKGELGVSNGTAMEECLCEVGSNYVRSFPEGCLHGRAGEHRVP